jgi:colanic acid/amylovoran biosynthesis glycosyltransferase
VSSGERETDRPVALQRCDVFVGRTMNWLYDHLRFVPGHTPVVLCDELANRREFPELEAWSLARHRLSRRLWGRIAGSRPFPADVRRARRYRPRVLHSHFGYVAAADRELRHALGCPWLVGFYGADVYALGRLPAWRERYAPVFREAARVLALGPVMARQLAEVGCPAEKIVVHALGVDVEGLPRRSRLLKRGEPLRVLFAGTLREKKGVRYVLDAVALARRAGVDLCLDLVGEAAGKPGDDETRCQVFEQIERLGLAPVVTHHPYVSFQRLLEMALEAHVFVAPSVTAADGDAEGTPFVLQQMMATAMPAIATVHSDIPFLFGDLGHLLVPERDAGAIAGRLIAYASEPARLAEHGEMLADQMRRHFNVRDCAARLSEIYRSVQ